MKEKLYKIGELARLSGVPVKTIRFYSDVGALPPAHLLASGYRLYSDADRARLELIRTLREIGIGLPAIIDLLGQKIPAAKALELQLEALEGELRTLKRQRALLKAALRKGEGAALAYLDRARCIAKLNALERERFLAQHLERSFQGVPGGKWWKANFWRYAVLDLPEEMTEAQLDAWLELAELVSDDSFIRRLNQMGRESWGAIESRRGAGWDRAINKLYAEAVAAMRGGHAPESRRAQRLVAKYVAVQARAMKRQPDREFPARLLEMIERATEPRAERYWELLGVLRGWKQPSPLTEAHRWLVAGLRWRVAHTA